MDGRRPFPADFRLGVATAAYQIEGAVAEGGRKPSIWDTYSHTPGRVVGGENGDVACDHYHRMPQDVALMADLGVDTYRFSISWSRVQPDGAGPLNPTGVDFYRQLIDRLRDAGIDPWVTLYHWDLPQALEDAGGWPQRDTAMRFADYATRVHDALGDVATNWTTLNEPWCAAFVGYGSGEHAPGRTDRVDALAAAHHLMLGHGMAVSAMRAARATSRMGVTLNLYAVSPIRGGDVLTSGVLADADAARRIDGLANRWFLDPVLLGRYPVDVVEDLREVTDLGFVRPGDLTTIAAPLDMLGINYYSRYVVGAPDEAASNTGEYWRAPTAWPGSEHLRFGDRGLPTTAMGWEIDAPGLLETLTRVHRDYPELPLYITENGAAFDDQVGPDGRVDDRDRVRYLDTHLRVCQQAIAGGVPLKGYLAWSLMDNFEWSWGYRKRFGLVHVDYPTQRRTRKASADWYADVAKHRSLPADPAS
jgi:beta-glucosidase